MSVLTNRLTLDTHFRYFSIAIQYHKHFYGVHIVLGIISNLEMILNIWEDTLQFYMREVRVCRCVSWNPSSKYNEEQLYTMQ